MAYDGKTLARARARLDEKKAANQEEHQRRLSHIYSTIPEVEYIDTQLRSQMAQLVRLTLSGARDLDQKLSALKNSNLDLQMRKAELLTAHGYPIDYLEEIVSCPRCHDTGIDHGSVCSCLETLYNEELTAQLGTLLRSGSESFEQFRLDYYSNEFDPAFGCVPREAMNVAYTVCHKFADKFPAVNSNLLLQGGPGLGKTYLSACIARMVSRKGYSVCYDSAAAAFSTFETQKFSRNAEDAETADARVKMMLECSLMILDDLGTEMITSISTSAFYTLLNTRIINNRPIIISTNLTMEELQKKYTQQIYSRISGEFMQLPFVGKDIRQLRRKY